MEKFTGQQIIDWKKRETDVYGYPIKVDENYVIDHHSGIDGYPEYVTLTTWQNSHSDKNYYPGDEKSEKEGSYFFDFPKTEKIEIRLRQDLADRLPKNKSEKNIFINQAIEYKLDGPEWLSRAGKTKTEAKSEAARENGKKGGRPKKSKK